MIEQHFLDADTLWDIPVRLKPYTLDDGDCFDAQNIFLANLFDHPEIQDVVLMVGDVINGYAAIPLDEEEAIRLADYLIKRVEFNKHPRAEE